MGIPHTPRTSHDESEESFRDYFPGPDPAVVDRRAKVQASTVRLLEAAEKGRPEFEREWQRHQSLMKTLPPEPYPAFDAARLDDAIQEYYAKRRNRSALSSNEPDPEPITRSNVPQPFPRSVDRGLIEAIAMLVF